MGMDTETEGLNPYDKRMRIISFAVSPEPNKAFAHYALNSRDTEAISYFKGIVEDPRIILIGHNIKYDINWLAVKYGFKPKCMLFDTMFAQYLLNENIESNSLEYLSEMFDDLRGYKTGINRSDLKRMAKDDVLIYNSRDADTGRRLFDVYIPQLEREGLLPLMNASMEVLPVLSKMETRGVYLDQEWAAKEKFKLLENAITRRLKINDLAKKKVDPDSPQSMRHLLYTVMKMPVQVVTQTGLPSVGKEAIKRAIERVDPGSNNEAILREALEYKKEIKLVSTYYQPIPRWLEYDGRVHTTYRLGKQGGDEGYGGTFTGRLSSDNPNLQNIPIGSVTRGMFAATPGYIFFDADYSQLELRVAAYLTQERLMMDAFGEGLDIHTKVMSDITGIPYDEIEERRHYDEAIKVQRVAIKRVNFGILYGVQAERLQKLLWLDLGITWPIEKCETLIRDWLAKYTEVQKWINYTKREAIDYGYITMPFGQRRRLPNASYKTADGRHALRQAINFPIQSTASWICLIGMTLLDKWLTSSNLNGHLLMQVHDSIGLEIMTDYPEKIAKQISRVMEEDVLEYMREFFDVRWNVPLRFEVTYGDRWK